MINYQPRYLLRFRSLAPHSKGYTRDSVLKSEIYLSDPASLNDPYDCQLALDMQGTDKEWRRHLFRVVRDDSQRKRSVHSRLQISQKWVKEGRHLKLDENRFSKITSNFGIACFSATFDNLLLWSHYADNHRGICLIFEPLKDSLRTLLNTFEVQYEKNPPRVRVVDLPRADESVAQNLLLTKSTDWRYEAEYRLILPSGANQTLRYDPRALVAIVLGAKISRADEEEVRKWVDMHPFRPLIHRAALARDRFRVQFNPEQSY